MKTMFTILTLALIVGSTFGQSAELHKAAYRGKLSYLENQVSSTKKLAITK